MRCAQKILRTSSISRSLRARSARIRLPCTRQKSSITNAASVRPRVRGEPEDAGDAPVPVKGADFGAERFRTGPKQKRGSTHPSAARHANAWQAKKGPAAEERAFQRAAPEQAAYPRRRQKRHPFRLPARAEAPVKRRRSHPTGRAGRERRDETAAHKGRRLASGGEQGTLLLGGNLTGGRGRKSRTASPAGAAGDPRRGTQR